MGAVFFLPFVFLYDMMFGRNAMNYSAIGMASYGCEKDYDSFSGKRSR